MGQRVNKIDYVPQKKRRRRIKKSTWILICIIIIYFAYNFVKLEIQYNGLQKKKEELLEEISSQKKYQQQLADEIQRSSSKEYIEYLARKYFGLVYPDEKIYIEVQPDENNN